MAEYELYHHGVLGMKWGVRRKRYAKTYSKGVEKLQNLDKKANKYKYKSDKLSAKSAKVYAKGKNDEKAKKLDAKARQLKFKATKYEAKGKKFYKKMENLFSDVPVKELNTADVEYGKKYANRVLS